MASSVSALEAVEGAAPVAFGRRLLATVGSPLTGNSLVRGDNLEVLRAAATTHSGAFRCVYLDPPFNTGRVFREYDDRFTPDSWAAMMRPRLEAIAPLVADDGAVFAEIDDTQLGTLLSLLDEVFGYANRIAIVTVVRSAATGHKARNAGPVNVTDFLLIYAKDRARWRSHKVSRPRRGFDQAYGTVIENREDERERWRFEPLARHVAKALGFNSALLARRRLGEDFARKVESFALENSRAVVRFAQPRYEAISRAARAMVDESRKDPSKIMVLEREGLSPFIVKGGNRLLFLSDKLTTIEGKPVLVEPLTNLWDDIPFQGIAQEGGVAFSRNKKPERLLERILRLATDPDDWVLDPFLGSGTTAAVAHKMGRRWVGIEQGETFDDLCVPRLTDVVAGRDMRGISRAIGWHGGGGFAIYT